MGLYNLIKNIAPLTAEKLKGKRREVVASISIALPVGFVTFLPALLTGIDTPIGIGVAIIGYALALFFIAAFGIFAFQLGIAKDLFADYTNMSPMLHWTLIIATLIATLMLVGIKLFKTLSLVDEENIKHGTKN